MRKGQAAVLAFILLLATTGVHAAVLQVAVPAHEEWCTDVALADRGDLSPETQQAMVRRAMEILAACSLAKQVTHLGVPFVAAMTAISPESDELNITFCAVAPGEAEPCEQVWHRTRAAHNVLASLCPAAASSTCRTEVEAALRGEQSNTGGVEKSTQVTWQFVGTAASRLTPEAVWDALTDMPLAIEGSGEPPATEPPQMSVLVVAEIPETKESDGQ